ncbi:hypothetical protein ABZ412_15515 [Nocardia sp. NPDC005746]|uniref:hypothetical protein n=1 Tax=Nocardia sp. NPDC005746 TaxID=3157062 RepID=UPI0033DC9C23
MTARGHARPRGRDGRRTEWPDRIDDDIRRVRGDAARRIVGDQRPRRGPPGASTAAAAAASRSALRPTSTIWWPPVVNSAVMLRPARPVAPMIQISPMDIRYNL